MFCFELMRYLGVKFYPIPSPPRRGRLRWLLGLSLDTLLPPFARMARPGMPLAATTHSQPGLSLAVLFS